VSVLVLACLQLAAAAAPAPPGYEPGRVRVGGVSYPYQLLMPLARHRTGPLPLVVFLHGAGERGDDNRRQCTWLPDLLAAPARREDLPCYVLAVQCPQGAQWVDVPWGEAAPRPFPAAISAPLAAVLAAMDEVEAAHAVDAARIYLTGLSMGGYGCFDLAARAPGRFAAVLAVCGGGDPAQAHRYVGLPFAIWHGAADPVVPAARSRAMVAAFTALGLPVAYRELPGVGHDAWRQAYGDGGALGWLFAQDQRQQQRGSAGGPPLVPAGLQVAAEAGRFVLGEGARCVAPGAARAAGVALAAAVAATFGRTLPVVDGPARSGDVELRIDGGARAPIELEASDVLVAVARDEASLQRAAAHAWQLLQQAPGGARGLYVAGAGLPGAVELATAQEWAAAELCALLGLCWRFGVGELRGPSLDRLDWLDQAQRAEVADCAARFGIAIGAPAPAPGERRLQLTDGVGLRNVAQLLADQPAAANGFVVGVPALPPGAALAALSTRLPAAVERARRTGPIPLGPFVGRLGALLRIPPP